MGKRIVIKLFLTSISLKKSQVQEIAIEFLHFHYSESLKRNECKPLMFEVSRFPVSINDSPVFLGSKNRKAHELTFTVADNSQSIALEADIERYFIKKRFDLLAGDIEHSA